jgi:hypothetical protein
MTLDQFLDSARPYISDTYPNFSLSVELYNACLNLTNLDYFKQWCGLPEDWKPGQPVTRKGWQIAEENSQALKIFLVTNNFAVVNGQLNYPSNLVHITRVGYTSINTGRQRPVELLTDEEIDDRLGDPVTYPTIEYPCWSYGPTYMSFYPSSIQTVALNYLRLPVTPVYTVENLNGVNQYNPTESTEFEWPSNLHNDILKILVGYLTMAAKSQLGLQIDNVQKQQGL